MPRVLLNCAVSHDGHLAGADGRPVLLSDDTDLQRVHRMRASVDAILVGVGTVVADDPSLRVKPAYASGPDPVRVILDPTVRLPAGARVLDGSVETLVYHVSGTPRPGATFIEVPPGDGGVDLQAVLDDLAARGIHSVMVEGGAAVLRSFLATGLWDEFTAYEAQVELGGGPALPSPSQLRELGVVEASRVSQGAGWLRTYARL